MCAHAPPPCARTRARRFPARRQTARRYVAGRARTTSRHTRRRGARRCVVPLRGTHPPSTARGGRRAPGRRRAAPATQGARGGRHARRPRNARRRPPAAPAPAAGCPTVEGSPVDVAGGGQLREQLHEPLVVVRLAHVPHVPTHPTHSLAPSLAPSLTLRLVVVHPHQLQPPRPCARERQRQVARASQPREAPAGPCVSIPPAPQPTPAAPPRPDLRRWAQGRPARRSGRVRGEGARATRRRACAHEPPGSLEDDGRRGRHAGPGARAAPGRA